MKTSFRTLFFIISLSALSLTGCNKHSEEPGAQSVTVDAQIAANETYTYTLPGDMASQSPEIATQAGQFEKSQLASDNSTYTYVPKANYTGTDQVVISVKEAGHHGGKHRPHLFKIGKPKHGCKDKAERVKQVTINLTIGEAPITVKE